MKSILNFADKIVRVYSTVYFIFTQICLIAFICFSEVNFTKNTPDIILQILFVLLCYFVCNLCFFIPALFAIAVSTCYSFLISISVPLFLFISIFQYFGASVNVLEYGFFRTLLILIILTPFGLMNLYSLRQLG